MAAVEAGQLEVAQKLWRAHRPRPSFLNSASRLLAIAYSRGDPEVVSAVREWYSVTADDLRQDQNQDLLYLIHSHRMPAVRQWINDFGLRRDDFFAPGPTGPAGFAMAAACAPPRAPWLWEFCVHCDRTTLAWLFDRELILPSDIKRGHRTLAETYNADREVAPWLGGFL